MKKIIKRMLQAKTKEELLTCEVDLQIQYNHLSEELLEDGAISEKDYEGILTFYRSSRELLVDINEKAENLQKKFREPLRFYSLRFCTIPEKFCICCIRDIGIICL